MEQKTSVVAVIPTRGLIFAETIISLFKNGVEKFEIVSGKPIPVGHNLGVRRALANWATHVLMVEDDMVIPDGTVQRMVDMDKPVVCVDYPMDNGYSTITRQDGKIIWCGLGCTLVKREVFEKVLYPWFDNSKSVKLHGLGEDGQFWWEVVDTPNKYGGHDIMFGVKLMQAKIPIVQLEGVECRHLRCENIKRLEKNDGQYIIKSLDPISKRTEYKSQSEERAVKSRLNREKTAFLVE